MRELWQVFPLSDRTLSPHACRSVPAAPASSARPPPASGPLQTSGHLCARPLPPEAVLWKERAASAERQEAVRSAGAKRGSCRSLTAPRSCRGDTSPPHPQPARSRGSGDRQSPGTQQQPRCPTHCRPLPAAGAGLPELLHIFLLSDGIAVSVVLPMHFYLQKFPGNRLKTKQSCRMMVLLLTLKWTNLRLKFLSPKPSVVWWEDTCSSDWLGTFITQRHVVVWLTIYFFMLQMSLLPSISATKEKDCGWGATFVSTAFVQNDVMTGHKRTEKEVSDVYLFLAWFLL